MTTQTTDLDKLYCYVCISKKMLTGIQDFSTFNSDRLFLNLLYQTIIAMPLYCEDYILEKAGYLLDNCLIYSRGDIVFDIYNRIMCIYIEKNDFDSAYKVVCKIKRYLFFYRKKHYKSFYYYMLARYYDAKISNPHHIQTENNEYDLKNCLFNINKAIRLIKHSIYPNRNLYLIRYCIFKLNIMMRSSTQKEDDIYRLHETIQKLLKKHTLVHYEVRCDYWMSLAWHYTLMEPNYTNLMKSIERAWKVAEYKCQTPLDKIDKIIIPLANMLCKLQYYNKAEECLNAGIKMCEEYDEIIPYVRKKINLMKYKLDVYYYSSDFEKCRTIISKIEEENNRCSKYGIHIEIPEEIYKQLYLKQ